MGLGCNNDLHLNVLLRWVDAGWQMPSQLLSPGPSWRKLRWKCLWIGMGQNPSVTIMGTAGLTWREVMYLLAVRTDLSSKKQRQTLKHHFASLALSWAQLHSCLSHPCGRPSPAPLCRPGLLPPLPAPARALPRACRAAPAPPGFLPGFLCRVLGVNWVVCLDTFIFFFYSESNISFFQRFVCLYILLESFYFREGESS